MFKKSRPHFKIYSNFFSPFTAPNGPQRQTFPRYRQSPDGRHAEGVERAGGSVRQNRDPVLQLTGQGPLLPQRGLLKQDAPTATSTLR